jgi:leucyl aminopeptidase
MTDRLEITFAALDKRTEPVVAVLAGDKLTLGPTARDLDEKSGGAIGNAADAVEFKGKARHAIELLALPGITAKRLLVIGIGKAAEASQNEWALLGGYAMGQITQRKSDTASLVVDVETEAGAEMSSDQIAAEMAFGAQLRHYTFRKYLTRKEDSDGISREMEKGETTATLKKVAARLEGLQKLVVHTRHPDKAKAAFQRLKALAEGVVIARDLVNEPANALGPVEFAAEARKLEKVGVEVEILDEKELKKLGFGALLCIAQGSERPARVAIMQWNGSKSKKPQKPLCFVGKGVVFDTGGISIKPAAGIIGLVENMPSGSAVRPGDIVTSYSGQTIEVLNTDAEGRLVLVDLMSYAIDRFKPRFVIDLATLTGAIMVALGKEYAGMFSTDDELVQQLNEAAKATGEKVWRMPLDKAFDKLIESKNADVKNIGGRWAGACTAAAFLQRFVKDTPWAHLDVAGTAMDATRNEINQSWGSGWGVRLLDKLVADNYEK